MPTRRERASATVLLVALTLGAGVSASAILAVPPLVVHGTAQAGAFLIEHLVGQPAGAARTVPADDETLGPAWTSTTAAARTTTTEPSTTTAPVTTTEPSPTTTAAPATTRPTSTADLPFVAAASSEQQRVVDLVNAARADAGCRPLAVDRRLVDAAQAHSTDMATNDYFSHTSQDGTTFAERIIAAGYPRPAAENIAKGQRSADDVMRAWMRSKGHRANILDCGITTIGVGLDTRGWYWTQDFGR